MSPSKRILKVVLTLVLAVMVGVPVVAYVAHRSGKGLGLYKWAKRKLDSFKGPPDGFPVTVKTRKGETVYFDRVRVEFVDTWNPEAPKPEEFRLETDSAGQLSVSSTLYGVTALEVLELPKFPAKSNKIQQAPQGDAKRGFDPASLGTGGNFGGNYLDRQKAEAYIPFYCRLKLTFDTGKAIAGRVTVHRDEFENRIWGNTPEGPRHMGLSHIASIKLSEPKRR